MIVVKESNFVYFDKFFAIFQILIFYFCKPKPPINEARGTTGLELVHVHVLVLIWFSQKMVLIILNVIFSDKICFNFSYKKLY